MQTVINGKWLINQPIKILWCWTQIFVWLIKWIQIGKPVLHLTHQVFHHAPHMKAMEHSFYQKLQSAVRGLIHLFFLHLELLPQVVHSVVLMSQVTQPIAIRHAVELQKAVIVPWDQLDLVITKLFNLHPIKHNGFNHLTEHGG